MGFARDTWVGKKRTKGWARKGVGKKRTKRVGKKRGTATVPKTTRERNWQLLGNWQLFGKCGQTRLSLELWARNGAPGKRSTLHDPAPANGSDNDSARATLRTKRRQDLDFTTKLSTTHRQYLSIAPRAPRTAYSRLIINQLARSDTNATRRANLAHRHESNPQ